MNYSRKGWWIAKASGVGLALVAIVLLRWLHPARPIAGLLLIGVVVAAGGLGIRAFFYRDEIERQTRMRCWYFGSMFGALFALLATISIVFFALPAPDAMTNFISHSRSHPPEAYFVAGFTAGFAFLSVAQGVGAWLVRAYLALPARSRA